MYRAYGYFSRANWIYYFRQCKRNANKVKAHPYPFPLARALIDQCCFVLESLNACILD